MNKIPNLPVVQMMPFAAIEEKREVLLVTSAPAWNAVKDSLRGLNIGAIVEVTEATTRHWDSLVTPHSPPEVVYSVGGGLAADAAKYIAAKMSLPLVVLPTALSVDAFLTAASGIRQHSSSPPERGAGGEGAFPSPFGRGAGSEGAFPSPSDRGAGGEGAFPSPSDRGAGSEGAFPSPFGRGAGSEGAFPSPSDRGAGSEDVFPSPFGRGAGSEGVFPSPFGRGAGSEGVFPSPSDRGAGSEGAFPSPSDRGAGGEGVFPSPFGRGAGVRDTCVYYLETKVPDILLLDLETIAKAPASIRAAGITDVLSIATGCWDWQFAHQQGKNPPGMEFLPWVYDNAQAILRGALDCAEAAGRGDKDGLKTLYHCLAMEVQLCNQIGHSRPEEGSEHYFAYAIENEMGHGLPHGDLVGPAILLIARLQGQNAAPLEKALKACRVPLNNISPDLIDRTLKLLPAYCQRHNLAFGIAHTLSLPPFPLGEG